MLRMLTRSSGIAPLCLAVVGIASTAQGQAVSREVVRHVVNRTSFGATLADLNTIVTQQDLNDYLNDQLGAPPTDYGAAGPFVTGTLGEGGGLVYRTHTQSVFDRDDLRAKHLVLAIECEHQLRECMTWFWEQHFSTSFAKVRSTIGLTANSPVFGSIPNTAEDAAIYHEWWENQQFRAKAFASFEDILRLSVFSPAMRYYLNLVFSQCRGENEDFGREFLELHTVGPNQYTPMGPGPANYTNDDIQRIAQVFQGLLVHNPRGIPTWGAQFPSGWPSRWYCHWTYDPANPGAQTQFNHDLFATTAPAFWQWTSPLQDYNDWVSETDSIIAHMASDDETKKFVCQKLIRFFVGDADADFVALDPLLNDCVTEWTNTGGSIEAVLRVILFSPEFMTPPGQTQPSRFWHRLENPVESTVSQARILGATLAGSNISTKPELHDRLTAIMAVLAATGATPHDHPSPDGFPMQSQRQPGTAVFWEHGEYAARIYTDQTGTTNGSKNLTYDPLPVVASEVTRRMLNWNSAADVADAALTLVHGSRWSPRDLVIAARILANTGTWPTGTPSSDELRIREMVGFVCALPQSLEK